MKKRMMLVVAVAAMLALAVAGCGKKSGGDGGDSKTPEIVGTWKAATVEAAGQTVDYDKYAEQLKAAGTDVTMEIDAKEDGKFTMNIVGQSMEGTWKEDGGKYTLTMNGADQEVTVKDGELTFDYSEMGMKIVFKK